MKQSSPLRNSSSSSTAIGLSEPSSFAHHNFGAGSTEQEEDATSLEKTRPPPVPPLKDAGMRKHYGALWRLREEEGNVWADATNCARWAVGEVSALAPAVRQKLDATVGGDQAMQEALFPDEIKTLAKWLSFPSTQAARDLLDQMAAEDLVTSAMARTVEERVTAIVAQDCMSAMIRAAMVTALDPKNLDAEFRKREMSEDGMRQEDVSGRKIGDGSEDDDADPAVATAFRTSAPAPAAAPRVPRQQSVVGEYPAPKTQIGTAEGHAHWQYHAGEPFLCQLIRRHGRVGGRDCFVQLHGNAEFHALRELDSMSPKLKEAVLAGPLESFVPGAGKSGSGFVKTKKLIDKATGEEKLRFVLKRWCHTKWGDRDTGCDQLGMKEERRDVEPPNLMRLVTGADGKGSLLEHLERHPMSLLNRVYGLFRVSALGYTMFVMVLGDATFGAKAIASKYQASRFLTYDLKGRSVDLTRRVPMDARGLNMNTQQPTTGQNGDFTVLEKTPHGDGVLFLENNDCGSLREIIRLDTDFLYKRVHIDYSVYVTTMRGEVRPGGPGPGKCQPGAWACFEHRQVTPDGKEHWNIATVQLIDYLITRDLYKILDSVVVSGVTQLRPMKFFHYKQKIVEFADRMCPMLYERGCKLAQERMQAVISRHGSSAGKCKDERKHGLEVGASCLGQCRGKDDKDRACMASLGRGDLGLLGLPRPRKQHAQEPTAPLQLATCPAKYSFSSNCWLNHRRPLCYAVSEYDAMPPEAEVEPEWS